MKKGQGEKTAARQGRWAGLLLHGAMLLTLGLMVLGTHLGRTDLSPSALLAAFSTLLPYLFLGLTMAYLLLFILLRNRWVLIHLGLILIFGLGNWGHLFCPGLSDPEGKEPAIKVMTWNVQRLGQWTGEDNFHCVRDKILEEQPDILVLLEITRHQLRDLEKELKTGRTPLWVDYYGKERKKYSGLAIMLLDRKGRLSANIKRKLTLPPQWKYLFAEFSGKGELKGQTFNVLALHVAPPEVAPQEAADLLGGVVRLDRGILRRLRAFVDNYRSQVALQGQQAGQAMGLIGRFKDPTIIMGDFNSTRDAALHVNLRKHLKDAWECRGFGLGSTREWAGLLPLRIDYIYVTPHIQVLDAVTPEVACSDHLPVTARVCLAKPALASTQ